MKHSISLSIFLVSVLLMGCKQSESEPLQPEPEPRSKYEIHGRIFHPCFDWTVSNLGNNIGDTIECGFWFSPYEYPGSDEEYSITLQKVVVESSTMQLHMEGKINLNSYDECFVRPYIRTRFRARYGESFIITPDPVPSFMKTGIITDITYSSANVTYQIESKGKSDITEYGIEWSTSAEFNYTSSNSHSASSSDQENLLSQPVTFTMFDLQPNTLYYVRAYAKNYYGTGYSNTWTVKTEELDFTAVDLGLSVKWANMNVGALTPEEYGDQLGSAHANGVRWGGNWRLPTYNEQQELRNSCVWTWTNNYHDAGIAGYEITGKNNQSIFLPAAGMDGDYEVGSHGYYWTSTIDYTESSMFYIMGTYYYYMIFSSKSVIWGSFPSYLRSVRLVCQ